MKWMFGDPSDPKLYLYFELNVDRFKDNRVYMYGARKSRTALVIIRGTVKDWNPHDDAELTAAVNWLNESLKLNLGEQALLGTFLRQYAISLKALEDFFSRKAG